MTEHPANERPMPPALARALRELPRARTEEGFTERVLERLDAGTRQEAGARGRSWTAAPRLAAAAGLAALTVAALTLAAALIVPETLRDRVEERQRALRLQAIEAERARLADELAEIRRMSREPLPVVYLGGDEEIDLVADPRVLAKLARSDRSTDDAFASEDETP